METLTYYGWIGKGKALAEVLVTRANGRQVSQIETGVTFRSMREASTIVGEKNAPLSTMKGGN